MRHLPATRLQLQLLITADGGFGCACTRRRCRR